MKNIIRKHQQLSMNAIYCIIAKPEVCSSFNADNTGRPEGDNG